jgi:molecular chaperone GrpE (heat shock protein)
MNWSEQLKNVQNNLYVSNYFTANNLNLEDFLNNYIKVDQIICKNCEPTTSELSNLLKNLQTQNDNIQLLVKNVQIDFSSYKIHLENSLRSITNNEIKDVVSQLLDKNSDKQFLENI